MTRLRGALLMLLVSGTRPFSIVGRLSIGDYNRPPEKAKYISERALIISNLRKGLSHETIIVLGYLLLSNLLVLSSHIAQSDTLHYKHQHMHNAQRQRIGH